MEAGIALLILVPIALLVLMIVLIARIAGLSRELEAMRRLMEQWMHTAPAPPRPAAPPPAERPMPAPAPPRTPPVVAPEPPVREAVVPPPVPLPVAPPPPVPRPVEAARPVPVVSAPPVAPPPLRPPPPPPPSFFERHPDLEKFIGENLINKIGIAVLVVGIGLLLKYAIGKGLISETGRTLIGLAAGGALLFFAHRLRNALRAFSSVLVGGAIAVFYSTIYIAFHEYRLIGQVPAFGVMVAITALAVVLTLAYDRKELAVIALLGGFAAPFLASSGEGNFRVLFTYLLILDTGMLVLANYKKWHLLHILSLGLTVIIFGGWAVSLYPGSEPRPALLAFAFATGFFLIFFGMGLRYNLRHGQAFTVLDHVLLLLNTAVYYGLGLYFLDDLPVRLGGLFTALLGVFYLGFAYLFHRREGIPRSLQLLLIGLVLTFISLSAPVQLQGSRITLFWAAEAVLLLWFAHRTQLRLVERGSVLVSLLMTISLGMDLAQAYGHQYGPELTPVLNKGWITGMVAAASFAGSALLLRRVDRTVRVVLDDTRAVWLNVYAVMATCTLYAVNYLELRYQLGRTCSGAVVDLALMAYTLFYVLVLDRALRRAVPGYRTALVAVMGVCVLVYMTGFHTSSMRALGDLFAGQGPQWAWVLHYLAFALLVAVLVRLVLLMRVHAKRPSAAWKRWLWVIAVVLVMIASQELDHLMALVHGTLDGLDGRRRVGYPILWGVGSFVFMWYGMQQRIRTLRVIALCLFGITLLKLFVLDLRGLSQGGQVAAFIVLGVLLLVVSFMYQRLKGLLREDAPADGPDGDGTIL